MPPSHASIIARLLSAAAKSSAWTFTATTRARAQLTQVQPSVIGPLFRTAGHTVRTQHGVTASAGQRRGDVEIRNYLRDLAGSRSLVFDLSIAHNRFGSSSHVQQNGCLSHPQDIDAPLRIAAQRKIAAYRQQYADNQNLSFLPAIVSTSCPMHGEILRLLLLTGPPGNRGALHCSWNVIAKLPNGRVPFQARTSDPPASICLYASLGLADAHVIGNQPNRKS